MKGSLQEKCGKYYAVFRINGKQKWINLQIDTTKGNKRKAEKALNAILFEYNNNPNAFDKIEFTSYIRKWLKSEEVLVDTITYEGYKQYAEKHIIPYFSQKNKMLQDMTVDDIEQYYNFKAVSGRLDGKEGGLSLRTIKLHGTVLSLVFEKAVKAKLIIRTGK